MSTQSKSPSPLTTPSKKRFLERFQTEERLQTIQEEEAEAKAEAEAAAAEAEAASVKFSKRLPDVFFCGTSNQSQWQSVKTMYIELDGKAKIMVRTDPANRGTMQDLKTFLIEEFKLTYVQPTFSYKSKQIPDSEMIVDQTSHKRQTIVFAEGVFQGHNGYLYSCETCRDGNNMMMGALGRRDFMKKHNKPECKLYQKEFAQKKNSWGFDCQIDKHNILHGHPKIEGNPQRVSKKFLASKNPTPSQDCDLQERKAKGGKDKKIIKLPSFVKPDHTDSGDEDSDREPEQKKVKRDNKVSDIRKSRTGKIRKQMKTNLDYPIPPRWETSGLPEAKLARQEMILAVRAAAYEDQGPQLGHWRLTDEEDKTIWEEKILSEVYKTSARYQINMYNMTQKTRDNLKKGKKAEVGEEDSETKTASIYTDALPLVMRILQKHLDRPGLKLQYFFNFGKDDFIHPCNIYRSIEEDPCSIGMKQHTLYAYIHILEAQRREAERSPQLFRSLVNKKDKDEVQIQHKSMKEQTTFLDRCTAIIALLADEAKKINRARTAQTVHNKKVAREIKGNRIPNPTEMLPKYWADSEVQKLEGRLWEAAREDQPPVTVKELDNLTEYVITTLLLKNGVRNQVVTRLKNRHYLQALERLIFYPYRPKEDGDGENDDDQPADGLPTGFTFDKNRTEDVPEEEADFLKGCLIEQELHKTALQGAARLFLDKLDITRVDLYRSIVKKYSRSIDKEYPIDGPLFVNGQMREWSNKGKRQLSWRNWCRVCGISEFHSHWTRTMLASFASSKKSLLIRELAAMAASHSLATQQKTYKNQSLEQLQIVQFSDYYRTQCKLIEQECENNPGLPYINDQYQKDLQEDLLELSARDLKKHMEDEAAQDREKHATEFKSMTNDVKYEVFRLLIAAGDTFVEGRHNWHFHYPELFMTGQAVRNQEHKVPFLMLFDYAKASDCSVTLALTDNLCEVAKIWAMKDRDSSDEEFVSLVENRWTNSIMEMITNMQFHTEEIRRTRLKNLLAEFNLTHDYQFCFNNESIKTSLQLYNDAQGAKKDALMKIGQRDKDFTAKKALQSYHETAQKRADEEAERKLIEEDRRAKERDQCFEEIPDTSSSLKRIRNTPSKIEIAAGDQTVTVSVTPNKLGKRLLEDPRNDTPAKLRKTKSYELGKSPKKGKKGRSLITWTDLMVVQLLNHWIQWAPYPFARDHSYNGGKVAGERRVSRLETFDQMKKKCHLIIAQKGRSHSMLLGDITQSNDTLWDKLMKKNCALKDDKGTEQRLLDYVDQHVERKKGPYHKDLNIWTDKMAREEREEIIDHLYDKIGERPGEPESGGEADLDSSED